MRFIEFNTITEDTAGMQAINRISVEITDYLNRNPGLVKENSVIRVKDIVKTPFKDQALEYLRQSVDIRIENMSEFTTVDYITGRKERYLPGGSMGSQFRDPKTQAALQTASDLVQFDRLEHKTGGLGDSVQKAIDSNQRLYLRLPAEILTRSLERGPKYDVTGTPKKIRQIDVDSRVRQIRSTLAHEFNHAYNTLQGMDLARTRTSVEQNKNKVNMFKDISMLLANLDDAKTIMQFEKTMGWHQNQNQTVPKAVERLVSVSKDILDLRKRILADTQYIEFLDKEITQHTGLRRQQLEQERVRVEEFTKKQYKKLQGMINTQLNLRTQVEAMRPPPDLPTDYMRDAYSGSPTELNSRLQQASLQIAEVMDEFKRAGNDMKVLDKQYQIMKAFGDHDITQQFMSARNNEFFKKHYGANNPWLDAKGEFTPQARQNLEFTNLSQTDKEFQRAAFNSAMQNPQYKRLVTIVYKFMEAEIANPTPLATKASLGMKLRALLTGVTPSEIPKTVLPNYTDSLRSVVAQFAEPTSAFRRRTDKWIVDTVKLSQKWDTPAAIKAMETGGTVLMYMAAVTEIVRGFDQVGNLSVMLTPEQRRQEITKIVTKLIAEFGLIYVSAVIGSILAGSLASAALPGLGTVAGGIVGFIGGGVAGAAALTFAGSTVEEIVNSLVKHFFEKERQKPGSTFQDLGTTPYTEELARLQTLARGT